MERRQFTREFKLEAVKLIRKCGSDMTMDLLEPVTLIEEMEGSAVFPQGSPLPPLPS